MAPILEEEKWDRNNLVPKGVFLFFFPERNVYLVAVFDVVK